MDQRDRNKITDILDRNFLVEAGAGSGKTTSLVDRMVNLIYIDSCNVENIVAITFTRKAADELKTRFQNKLEKTWKKEDNAEVKQRLELAIQNMERCFLGTVHAFCARLLRERPVEANLDITFKELEEEEDTLVAEEAWYTYLTALQEENVSVLEKIRHIGLEEHTLLDRFQSLKNYPDVEWVMEHQKKPEMTSYDAFIALLKEASRSIPEHIEKGPDNLQKAIQEALRKDTYLKRNNKMMLDIFDLFDKKTAFNITQNRWISKEDSKDYKEKIKMFFDDRIAPFLQAWREYIHPIIIEFLQGALQVYESIKKQRSLMNFQDLLINTSHLLKENPEVRKYFQQKYQCLLVDEFQDTDPIQAEMMFYLTGEDVTEKDWRKCMPLPGSLFVVGDPKQAIYRFRRADIDIYNKVKELIKEHGGDVLQLTMNFRTVDTVTTRLNEIFVEHLPEQESKYQAAYRSLNAYHEEKSDKPIGIKQLSIPSEFTKNQQNILEKDAENICLSIQSFMEEGHEPRECMIITRYNAGIDVYANVLEEAGIPVSVSGEMEMGRTQAFNELVLLLQVFVDPTDSLATVAALRSIYFGIADEQLYQWKKAGGNFSIYSKTPGPWDDTNTHPVQHALSKLRMFNKWTVMYSPVVTIEKILEDIGFYPLMLSQGYGKREYTQFLQLIEALRKQEDTGRTLYNDAIQCIKTTMESKSKVVNLDEDRNAVRILNIHKAKGLEAPIVFLANPGKKTNSIDYISSHIKREGQASKGYFKFSKKVGYASKTIAQPKEWESFKEEEGAYLLQEEIRIIYVAATRAEKGLVISCCDGKDSKNPWRMLLDGLGKLDEAKTEANELEKETTLETITKSQLHSETAHLSEWMDESATTSFAKMSPTDEKPEIYTLGIEREKGGGKGWGSAIHELFERYVKGELTRDRIIQSLRKHELSIDREEEVKDLLVNFEQTYLWLELQKADQLLTEVPFSLAVRKGDSLYDLVKHHNMETVYVSGIIDLIYKHEGKWKIIDFKTDRPKDMNVLPELTRYYKGQIDIYTRVWEHMTGEKVDTSQLYYVTPNKVVTVEE